MYPLFAVFTGLLIFGACAGPSELQEQADIQVREILAAERDALGIEGELELEQPTERLRLEILSAREEGREPDLPTLGLVACLQVAAENSRSFQDQREQLFRSALDLTTTQWTFETQGNGFLSGFFSGDGNGGTDTGTSAGLGLVRLFKTGAQVVADVGIDLVKSVGNGDGWDAISSFSVGVTQPLLRGFGREIVREPLTQAERDVLYEVRSFERFRRTFAFDVTSRYFRLIQQQDTLDNELANLERLRTIRERNEAFARAGRQSDIQVDQARQDEVRAESRVVDTRRNLASDYDDFKFFLGLPLDVDLVVDDAGMTALQFFLDWADQPMEESTGVALALAGRLDHLTVVDRLADAERRVKIAADALRAGLDLGLDLSGVSPEGRPLDMRNRDLSWTLSADVDLPIDRLVERNSYRSALLSRDAAARSMEESADGVAFDIRDALRNLGAAKENLLIQEGAVELNLRRVESAALNLEAGRSETRDLLDAQRDLLAALNDVARARTDYALAALALARDLELMVVDDGGIHVADISVSEPHSPNVQS